MLRMAMLGVGWAGTRQVEAARELGRKIEVVALVDNDEAHLRAKATDLNIDRVSTDLAAVLADPAIDAVSISLPHALHHPIAMAAIAAGKHVLVEKPMAMTVEQASEMIAAADATGVKLYVAENEPYTPRAIFLREIVRSGRYLGELTGVSLVAGFRALGFSYPGRRAWLTRPEEGGTGTWMLHGIHTISHLRFILGEVETVYMRAHRTTAFSPPAIEGTMSGLLTLTSGVNVAVMQTSETALPPDLEGYVIHGTHGSVRATRHGCEITGDDPGGTSETRQLPYPAADLSDYALELEAFADYVAGVAEGPTTGRSERRTLAIVQAGYESAASGQPVNLRQRFGDL